MYIPKHFRNEDPEEIRAFIRANGFGILINRVAGQLHGTHLPLEWVVDPHGHEFLQGHISRANPQWREFAENDEVLAIFTGPHTYISPSWYDHENVPTWNYQAVHVFGRVHLLEGEELLQSLRQLVNHYEAGSPAPVTVEGMSPDFLAQHLRGLVGVEITIDRIEAVDKLSQNRDNKNHTQIVDALEQRKDEESHRVAEAMKKQRSQE